MTEARGDDRTQRARRAAFALPRCGARGRRCSCCLAFGLLAARLVYLQVVRHDDCRPRPRTTASRVVPVVPNRGLILDRNGVVLAQQLLRLHARDHAAPRSRDLDATDRRAGRAWSRSQPRDRALQAPAGGDARASSRCRSAPGSTDEEVARFAAQRFRFPGVEIKARLFRNYPLARSPAHVIGYIGRINQAEKTSDRGLAEDDRPTTSGTDYIGKLGVEQSYESELHGTTGVEEVEVDRRRPRGAHAVAQRRRRRATT